MNKTKTNNLHAAIQVKAQLAAILQSGVPMSPENFNTACDLYARAVILVASLESRL